MKIIKYVKQTVTRLFKDPLFRAECFLKAGLLMNFAYTLFGLFTGLFYRSVWFAGTAVYYIMLCILKFYLLRKGFGIKKGKTKGLLTCRNCGRLLLVLNAVMLVLIYQMVEKNRGYEYSDMVLTATAVYTFVRLFAAVGDRIFFSRDYKSPTLFAARTLSLTVAMMAMFTLQVTLLDRFGTDPELRRGLNIITGATVGIAAIVIALRLIAETERHLDSDENSD